MLKIRKHTIASCGSDKRRYSKFVRQKLGALAKKSAEDFYIVGLSCIVKRGCS